MSKARSQMPQKSGRVEAAHGEAVGESASDEARDPLTEHRDTGLAKTKAGTGGLLEAALAREANWDCPASHDLKLSNRPVRTRMPGGVAGVSPSGDPLCRWVRGEGVRGSVVVARRAVPL